MSWHRFNRGDCPVCNGVRKDCRQSQDTNLVHCRSSKANPPDYIYRGQDRFGFGMWAYAPDAEAWSEEKLEEWRRGQESTKKRRKQQEQERQARSLSAKQRDLEIKKVLSQLSLSDRHRKQLRDRGLTDQQIKDGGCRSLNQWQKLNSPVSDRLAGVKLGGKSLVNFGSGILCPIRNHEGLFTSWQVRQDDDSNGKYIWAASERNRKNRPSAKTKEFNELPLGVCQQPNKKGSNEGIVGLTEGTSIKPHIASNKLNIPVIGASGGNFASSPQTLKTSLKAIAAQEIIFYPDGGAVLNPHVMKQYEKTFNLLQEWGYPVKIAWWEQIQKSDGDIDEIDSAKISKIVYLSPKKFLELAKKEQYIQQQVNNWRNHKKFTPQIKINHKFIDYDLPQENTITFIKSGLGTGKTTKIIQHLLQVQKYGIIGIGYRNTLLLQFNEKAKKIGFYHLQSDKNLREFSLDDPGVKVTNCVDSLIHYIKEQFDGKIVIIDEIISVLKHLLFSTTIKQFSRVKELFTEMINRCDRLVCLDGFMQDWAVTFFRDLCPNKQIVTIENIHQGDKAKIYLLEGIIDIKEKLRANDKTPWLKKLLDSDCPVVTSDSQVFCEAMENLLIEQGRRGIRGDSKTTSKEEVKEFFRDPDKWIAENKPEYIILSPSAESGLDISLKNYFTGHFAFFFGQLDIDSCIQFLGRIRDTNCPKYIWCKKFVVSEDTKRRPSNVESIQGDRARLLMKELHSTLNNTESPEAKIAYIQQIYQNNLDPYTTAADTIQAIHNHEFSNYRECLKQQLTDSGYLVEAVTLEAPDNRKEIARQEKEAKTEVKENNATDFYHASDRYIGQEQVNLNFDTNWETRCAVTKARIVSQLPGINHNPVWSPEFIKLIKYDKPNLIKQTELYYLLNNPDLAQQLSLSKYNGIHNQGHIAAPWKLRQNYLKIKTLRDVDIHNFIQRRIDDPSLSFQKDSSEVKAIVNKCRQKKNKDILGLPGKDSIKFFGKLLRSVGVEIRSKKVKQNGKTISVYYLNQKHLVSEERLAILQAVQLKYELKINSQNQPLEWVVNDNNLLQNSPANKFSSKIPETTLNKGFDSVAFYPKININNSTKYNLQDSQESLDNLSRRSDNTSQIQSIFDTKEAIADLAWMLDKIEDSESLTELQTAVPEFTHNRLNLAARLLLPEQQKRLRQWAIENKQRRSTS